MTIAMRAELTEKIVRTKIERDLTWAGLAALASRMTSVQHTEFDLLLERLLQILRNARSAGR